MTHTNVRKRLDFRMIFFLSLSLLGIAASPALAKSAAEIKAMEKEAKAACLSSSQYEKGIDILAELYAETNDTGYIYNQARCYQQGNQAFSKALGRFQEYQRKNPKLNPKDQADLEQRIAECEAQIAKASPPPASPTESSPASAPIILSPNVVEATPPPPEPSNNGQGLRTTGVILSVLGVVGIGTGVTLNLIHSDKAKVSAPTYASDIETKTNGYRTYSLVGYGVGAAALATGITLYILGSRSASGESSPEPSVALIPSYFGGSANLTLKGSF